MPFIPHTPEGLLVRNRRSNSNNRYGGGSVNNENNNDDDYTCRGVTAKGEPCRRTVATARTFGHEAIDIIGDVALYCWQHKDQAQHVVNAALEEVGYTHGAGGFMRVGSRETKTKEKKKTKDEWTMNASIAQERSSIDTLVARLGMIDIDGNAEKKVSAPGSPVGHFHHGDPISRRNKEEEKTKTKSRRHDGAQLYNKRHSNSDRHSRTHDNRESSSRKRSSGSRNWLSAFCLTADTDDDYFEIVRHKSRIADEARRAEMASATRNSGNACIVSQPASHQLQNHGGETCQVSGLEDQARLDPTSHHLPFIPESLSPRLRLQLLDEMSKPISRSDDEGYIYMYRLNDSKTRTSSNTASSLLSPSNNDNYNDQNINMDKTSPGRRRVSNNMNNIAAATATTTGSPIPPPDRKEPILLKIGRASNVHRRMNEWSRQCDYSLSVIRWYPYVSSSSSSSSSRPTGDSFFRSSSTPTKPTYGTAHNQSPSSSPSQHRRSSIQHIQAQAQARAVLHPPTTLENEFITTANNNNNNNNNTPTTAAADATATAIPSTVRKVPHARRVERLIHIELAEKRVRRNCAACGKQHREWFEVENSRIGVRAVDEVIRRWVRWSNEQQLQQQ